MYFMDLNIHFFFKSLSTVIHDAIALSYISNMLINTIVMEFLMSTNEYKYLEIVTLWKICTQCYAIFHNSNTNTEGHNCYIL